MQKAGEERKKIADRRKAQLAQQTRLKKEAGWRLAG
jgi:hypothetical protein